MASQVWVVRRVGDGGSTFSKAGAPGWRQPAMLPVLGQWAVMAAAGASALAASGRSATHQSAILAAWVLAYGAICLAIDRRYPRSPDKHGAALRDMELHNNNRAPNAAAGRPSSRSTP